jgi:putative transposase
VKVQRTITILLPDDRELRQTLDACQQVQQRLSPLCYNDGKPLGAIALQRAAYQGVKGHVSSQMTISAIRLVASAYATAKSNGRPARRPFRFLRKRALFLVGQRGRDAEFRADGTLSLWTVAGRKRFYYKVPMVFREALSHAAEIDSLTLIERGGRLLARVTLTVAVPDPQGTLPVGVDLNETNALVAVDSNGRTLFLSGKSTKVANKRTRKTRRRLQQKLAARKAEKKSTRSVRRLLKRLGRKQQNRTRTFSQTAAKQLAEWAPANAVLVFEHLALPQATRKDLRGKAVRRRLSQWQRLLIRRSADNKALERGMLVAAVDPAYTSQICSRCGLIGTRQRHRFYCPHCGLKMHADVNAAINIRDRYAVLRHGGPDPSSTCSSTGHHVTRPRSSGSSPGVMGKPLS